MDRKYMIEVLNSQILPQVNSRWSWSDMTPARDIIKMIQGYRRQQIDTGTARRGDTLTATVCDGFLYINGDPVGRIAPKDPRPAFNEMAYYWEGRILARQERYTETA